jgi:hypothetical protein
VTSPKFRAVGLATAWLFVIVPLTEAAAQAPAGGLESGPAANESRSIGADIKAYLTAPARWEGKDWLKFGGTLAAIGVAYGRDDDVREHFASDMASGSGVDNEDLRDALPGGLTLVGTWLYAKIAHDEGRRDEAAAMTEAALLGSTTAFVLKEATGRARPDAMSDSSDWHSGGGSFPSIHVTAAFAIGTVLAESGNDRHRPLRRVLGYGIGLGTAYERLDHDAHWFSDTVAGAALGLATARFVMNRRRNPGRRAELNISPLDGGVLLSYARPLP